MDGPKDGRTDGWTETPSFRDARMHQKTAYSAIACNQGCAFQDLSAASASASSKNVAIPPMSAEAPDPADRFRFRFPDSNPSSASRDRTCQTSKMPSDFHEFLPKKLGQKQSL